MTSETTEITTAQLEVLAATAGVDIPAQYRDSVLVHLRVAQAMAQKVYAAPLPDDALEPAPVFEPWELPESGDGDA